MADHLFRELQEVAHVLYPNSAASVVLSPEAPGSVAFRIVPSAARPRLIARAGTKAGGGAATALASYSTALSTRQRLTRLAGSRIARTAWGTRLAGDGFSILLGDRAGESLEEHVSEVAGQPVHLTVGIGTRRANRKPVILVTDHSGRRLFYLKVGHNEVTKRLVTGEKERLSIVARGDLPTVTAPSVLDFHTWSGLSLLAISCLPTSLRDRSAGSAPLEGIREVARAFVASDGVSLASGSLDDLDRTIAGIDLAEPRTSVRLSGVRRLAAERLPADRQPFAWHGDWTPWNMSRARGRIQLWDWERFEVGVPFGLDALHYFVNLRTSTAGFSPALVRRGLAEGTDALGLHGDGAEELQIAYLVKLVARYAASLADEGGEAIKPKSDLLIDELECRLGVPRGGVGEQ